MEKKDLIAAIIEAENRYSMEFSTVEKTPLGLRFSDDLLPHMHCHNYLRIVKEGHADLAEAVREEGLLRERTGREAVQIERFEASFEEFAAALGEENLDEHLIMYASMDDLIFSGANPEAEVFPAETEEDLQKGKLIDRLTFGKEFGDFCDRRFDRKALVYRDPDSLMNEFICLDKGRPAGNCDFFYYGKFGKIEDFDVVGEFQRKGNGTAIIAEVSRYARRKGVEFLFLQVEKENSAVQMYGKLGFKPLFNNIIYNRPVEERP